MSSRTISVTLSNIFIAIVSCPSSRFLIVQLFFIQTCECSILNMVSYTMLIAEPNHLQRALVIELLLLRVSWAPIRSPITVMESSAPREKRSSVVSRLRT